MFYKLFLLISLSISTLLSMDDLRNIESFKSKFTQTVSNESGTKIEYIGDVFVKNSGKILWKYEKPIIKNVYVILDIVIVDEPELEQAIYATLDKEINILKLLNEAVKIDENRFKTKLYETEYFIDFEDKKIKKLSYKDELANSVEIIFNEVEQNIEIDDSVFAFLPPDYYDIIRK